MAQIKLIDVVAPFEQFDHGQCPFGNQECSDERPCFAHDKWKSVVEAQRRFLSTTTVRDVARGARSTTKGKRSTRKGNR